MNKKTYEIDGKNFSNMEEFWDEISDKIIPKVFWGRNLDAFNDILFGGFGTPDGGFVLIWKNSEISKEKLGYEETIRWLEKKFSQCHPSNIEYVKNDIKEAKLKKGKTLFEIILEIIESEEHNDIQLILEK